MPYHMEWLVPNQVLYIYNYGHVTVTETEKMMEQSFAMSMSPEPQEAKLLVHVITDPTDVIKSEVGIQDIRRIFGQRKNEATHPGWAVTVANSAMDRFMGSIALQFMGIRGRQVASVADGINFLAKSDDTLPSVEELFKLYEVAHARIKRQIEQQ